MKRELSKTNNITLIEIPYYWDLSLNHLKLIIQMNRK